MISVALALLAAWLVPQLSALALRLVLARGLPAEGHERRVRLFGFRRAAFLVGLVQIQLAWMHGVRSVGPSLGVFEPGALPAFGVGMACALLAFVSGGVARSLVETPAVPAGDVALLRLRLSPLFAGPVVASLFAARLPFVDDAGHVGVAWALVALLVVALGVAYGGLVLSVLTFALRPATPEVTALARDVAAKEGTWLGPVLRLPTRGARLANAAALPWARTMVVTDRIVTLLDTEALRAVLAHEAGHLSERPIVAVARLGTATALIYSLTCGLRIAFVLPVVEMAGVAVPVGFPALLVVLLASLVGLLAVRRLARRMEQRADARAMETVGGLPLARALRAIGEDAELPFVTGQKRVHPDLWDRLVALGDDPGPRPTATRSKAAPRVAVLLGALLVAGYAGTMWAATVPPAAAADATPTRTAAVLAVDPWDPGALLAGAWGLRREGDLDASARQLALVRALAGDDVAAPCDELRTELLAAEGRCAEACEVWRDSAPRAPDPLRERLELRERRTPPTYEVRCAGGCE